jgi:tetratricopeptide (TPR) repeat protein
VFFTVTETMIVGFLSFKVVLITLIISTLLCASSGQDGVKQAEKIPESYWATLYGDARTALNKLFASNAIETGKDAVNNISKKLSDEESQVLIEEGNLLIGKGDYNSAVNKFITLLDSNPFDIAINVAVGLLFLNPLQRSDLAENFLYTAVRLSNWTDINAISNLATCLRLNNDTELGEKVALKGLDNLKGKDESGTISNALGFIKADMKDYVTASDWFLASALLQPQNIAYWLRASTMLFPPEGRDLKFAENVLLQGIESNPNNAQLLYQLGVVTHTTNDIENAIPLYEAALTIDPSLEKVKSTLATAYHAIRRFEDAELLYQQAIIHEPSNVILLANYALLLCVELTRVDDGLRFVSNAKEIDPYHSDVVRAETECLLAQTEKNFFEL